MLSGVAVSKVSEVKSAQREDPDKYDLSAQMK